MKTLYSILISLCLLLCLSSQLTAQDLTLFPNVLIKGKSYVTDIAQTSDGSYLIAGMLDHINGTNTGDLVKIDQFGNRIAAFNRIQTNDHILKIATLPDGKILISGWFTNVNGTNASLVRLNADGTLDATFQKFTISTNEQVYRFAIQSTGKILVTGYFSKGMYSGLIRLNPDGSVDNTFTPVSSDLSFSGVSIKLDAADNIFLTNGHSLFKFAANGGTAMPGFPVSVDADGTFFELEMLDDKILIGGSFKTVGGVERSNLALLNADGTLDSFSAISSAVNRLAVTSDKKIVVTNYSQVNVYDNTGAFLADIAQNATERVFIDQAGKIIVSGGIQLSVNEVPHPFMVRFNSDLSVDNSFTCQPTLTTGISAITSYADGRMLVGTGYGSGFAAGIGDVNKKLVRISPDGTIDPSFNPTTVSANGVHSLAIQDDGKALVCADQLTRLNASGSVDNTFSPVGNAPSEFALFSKVKIRNGDIFLSGYFASIKGHASPGIVKLKADGSVNTSFIAALPTDSNVIDFSFQSDGKIIVVGDFYVNTATPKQVLRLNTDGTLDNSFTTGATLYYQGISRLTVDSLDRIYVAGSFYNYNSSERSRLARLSPQGVIDLSFNPNMADFGINANIQGLEVLSNNEIFVGNTASPYTGTSMAVFDEAGNLQTRSYTSLTDQTSIETSYFNGETLYIAGRFLSPDMTTTSGFGYVNINPVVGGIDNLEASWGSPSTSRLRWTNSIIHGTAIVIERSQHVNSSFVPLDTISSSAIAYVDSTVVGSSSYYYRLKGINTHSSTPYSSEAFLAHQLEQTITFNAVPDKFDDAPFEISAVASSGLPVTFTSSDPTIAAVTGTTVTIHKSGNTMLTASQPGNEIYDAAKPVSVSLTVILPVGVDPSVSLEKVNFYPNPSKGLISVELTPDFHGGSYAIVSANGTTKREHLTLTAEGNLLIDLSSRETGLYLIWIEGKRQNIALKVVKE